MGNLKTDKCCWIKIEIEKFAGQSEDGKKVVGKWDRTMFSGNFPGDRDHRVGLRDHRVRPRDHRVRLREHQYGCGGGNRFVEGGFRTSIEKAIN